MKKYSPQTKYICRTAKKSEWNVKLLVYYKATYTNRREREKKRKRFLCEICPALSFEMDCMMIACTLSPWQHCHTKYHRQKETPEDSYYDKVRKMHTQNPHSNDSHYPWTITVIGRVILLKSIYILDILSLSCWCLCAFFVLALFIRPTSHICV